jgi:hypothetical protein
MSTIPSIIPTPAGQTRFDFNGRGDAWGFMRDCDAAGIKSGFPFMGAASYIVHVITPTRADADAAHALATKRFGV